MNISERWTCRVVGYSGPALWRPLKGRNGGALRARLLELAEATKG